eukprot:3308569-Prymnesium_polylepis.1
MPNALASVCPYLLAAHCARSLRFRPDTAPTGSAVGRRPGRAPEPVARAFALAHSSDEAQKTAKA